MEFHILNEHELKSVYTVDAQRDFPKSELRPWNMIEALYRQGVYEPIGFYECGKLIAYALLVTPKDCCTVLLDYFAVLPLYRGGGIGSEILNTLKEHFKGRAKYIILESEHPDEAPDKSIALRRLDFYRRSGAILTDIQDRLFGVLFHIFIIPCGSTESLDLIRELEAHYHVIIPAELYDSSLEFYTCDTK